MIRALSACAVLLASAPVYADSFAELGLGFVLPASDDRWTDFVDPSLKLAVRFGGGGPDLGGMASFDWTPVSSEVEGVSLTRLRLMGHVRVASTSRGKVTFVGRFGAGIDYLRAHTEIEVFGARFEGTDTDVGLALEAAGGAWFNVGPTTQIGFEVALPIGLHFEEGNPNNPNDPDDADFEYTSIDIDILGGVRFLL